LARLLTITRTRAPAKAAMPRKTTELPEFPPLWETPAQFHRAHNGGPPLEPRTGGRPTISTPELRARILELLGQGLPLRAICRVPGMPHRVTIYAWRRSDPAFDRQCEFWAQCGREHLVEMVSAEFDEIIQRYPPKVARRWWNLRRRQLIRVNPRFFGGPP
jgi:hypothetical protein